MTLWSSAVGLSCKYLHVGRILNILQTRSIYRERAIFEACVTAATWTTVNRSKSPRTMSTKEQRASDQSASSCCGFWGRVVTER